MAGIGARAVAARGRAARGWNTQRRGQREPRSLERRRHGRGQGRRYRLAPSLPRLSRPRRRATGREPEGVRPSRAHSTTQDQWRRRPASPRHFGRRAVGAHDESPAHHRDRRGCGRSASFSIVFRLDGRGRSSSATRRAASSCGHSWSARAPERHARLRPRRFALPVAPSAPVASADSTLEFTLREGVFEEQSATIVDAAMTPPARMEVAGARLTIRDFVWPSRTPAEDRADVADAGGWPPRRLGDVAARAHAPRGACGARRRGPRAGSVVPADRRAGGGQGERRPDREDRAGAHGHSDRRPGAPAGLQAERWRSRGGHGGARRHRRDRHRLAEADHARARAVPSAAAVARARGERPDPAVPAGDAALGRPPADAAPPAGSQPARSAPPPSPRLRPARRSRSRRSASSARPRDSWTTRRRRRTRRSSTT